MKRSKAPPRHRHRAKSKLPFERRGLWTGSIVFGLVNIPVTLQSAQQEKDIHFRLIDKRDKAPIGYRQFNKATGEEVSPNTIVKGFEHKKGHFVLMNPEDFKKANVRATGLLEIEDFVKVEEIDPMFFVRPYYVLPRPGAEKGYALLRDVLSRTHKAAVAKIVLHSVQHLCTLMVRGDFLILELLRFANEIKDTHEVASPELSLKDVRVTERELSVAEQLVDGMSTDWKPDKYHNDYREDLMRVINAKVKRGGSTQLEEVPETKSDEVSATNVVDLTSLLKKSLSAAKRTSRGA